MRAYYVGYTSDTNNHGDEALIWIIRDLLAPEIEVITQGDRYEVALLGGGTLINQSPWLIDHFESVLNRAGRGFVFGTGVGDLTFWGNHFERWVPLLKQCDAVGVRGPQSVELLRSHGFKDAVLTGDPYLWLQAPVSRAAIPKRLCVNIGSTNNATFGKTDQKLCDTVIETLQILKDDGWTFSLMSVWDKDISYLEQVATAMGTAIAGPILNARTHPLEVYSELAGSEIFLGEKLHANAMAAVAGTPFIALEYQPKVRDFAASLQMEDWTISTADASPETLVAIIQRAQKESGTIRNNLQVSHLTRRNSIIDFAVHVKQIMLGTPPRVAHR